MLTIAAGTIAGDAMRSVGPRYEIGALEIDIDDVVPFRPGHLDRGLEQCTAGIVDQNVDVAEGFDRGGEGLRDNGLAAQIELHRHHLAALHRRIL